MRLSFFVLLVAITFALSLEKKNQQLRRTNGVLLQALRELTTSNEAQAEKSVGFFGTYKCLARNDCISSCQDEDSSKTRYECLKKCPKSLCDKDAESESMDPEDDDSEEEAGVKRGEHLYQWDMLGYDDQFPEEEAGVERGEHLYQDDE